MDPQAIAALVAQVMQQMRLASPTPEPQQTYAANLENQLTRQLSKVVILTEVNYREWRRRIESCFRAVGL